MGHGFFVPAIAAYIVWLCREELFSQPFKPDYRALILLVWASIQLYIGSLGAELFLQRTSLVLTIIGCVWLAGGIRTLRLLAFPLFLLFFMVPLPAIVYNQITFPLQMFASSVADHTLNLIGIPTLREGNILELANNKLSVVEACSGIRSLLALTFLSVVYGFFADSKPWMRFVLLAGVVPIAIIANAARVTLTGIISEYDRELAQGFFHTLEGWVIFMVAFALLFVLHRVVNWTYEQAQLARQTPPIDPQSPAQEPQPQ
jgi:exosortase